MTPGEAAFVVWYTHCAPASLGEHTPQWAAACWQVQPEAVRQLWEQIAQAAIAVNAPAHTDTAPPDTRLTRCPQSP